MRGTATGKSEWDFDIKDEDAMTSDSATAVPTQQSTKAYVDTHAADTTTHGATGAVMGTTNEQTASGKTLTTPVIASLYQDAGKTKLMTTPNTASDTLCAIAATQTLTNKTLTTPTIVNLRGNDGWNDANETWTYASTTTFTVPTDLTTKYTKGTKIKCTNATVKYFYVVKSAYSDPNTTVTVTGGTDYALADAAITLNYYSYQENPQGFPDVFNFTPTWVGFSADPTGHLHFVIRAGRIGLVPSGDTYGTSNATNFTMTLPLKALSTETSMGLINVKNNSVNSAVPGHVGLGTGSATANLYSSFYGGAWTASNLKGFYCNWLWYEYTV